jgi:transcriptional regulator with XRE-family HTH domain
MTDEEFKAAIEALGLSQLRAGKLLGASVRSARRWAAGGAAIPESVATLLRLLLAGKITVEDIEAAKPAKPKRLP